MTAPSVGLILNMILKQSGIISMYSKLTFFESFLSDLSIEYRICSNRPPAFYSFSVPLDWRIVQNSLHFALKGGQIKQNCCVLMKSGVLLQWIG